MKGSIQRERPKGKGLPALDSLGSLEAEEAVEQWKILLGSDPPSRLRRLLMIHALAYRLQEGTLGGLKPATRRLLVLFRGQRCRSLS
jgi:hypothetical protein